MMKKKNDKEDEDDDDDDDHNEVSVVSAAAHDTNNMAGRGCPRPVGWFATALMNKMELKALIV